MFAQLCTDLPWTQHLSEVWRMRDPDERTASLALRDGGPASVRRAVGWYRTHDRLHCGDQITMAADALAAYQADIAAGKDALLVCDTTEMADALNQRLHHDTIRRRRAHRHRRAADTTSRSATSSSPAATTPPSRCATPTTPRAEHSIRCATGNAGACTHINPDNNRLHRRAGSTTTPWPCSPTTTSATTSPYGYAVTVHAAQGVTADTTHAVLSENATRALAYVAMTRGRDTNTAYLYERATEPEHRNNSAGIPHVANRGTAHYAAALLRTIVANDQRPRTAHEQAAKTPTESLDAVPRAAVERRAVAVRSRKIMFRRWSADDVAAHRESRGRDIGRSHAVDHGLESVTSLHRGPDVCGVRRGAIVVCSFDLRPLQHRCRTPRQFAIPPPELSGRS